MPKSTNLSAAPATSMNGVAGSCCESDRVVAWGEPQVVELSLAGASGSKESPRLAERIEHLPGVLRALANPITEHAVIEFDPRVTRLDAIVHTLESSGLKLDHTVFRWYLRMPGVACAACVHRIEEAIDRVPGVLGTTANPKLQRIVVEYAPRHIDFGGLRRVLESLDTHSGGCCKRAKER